MDFISNSLSTVFNNLENIINSKALDRVVIFKNQQCPVGCVLYMKDVAHFSTAKLVI